MEREYKDILEELMKYIDEVIKDREQLKAKDDLTDAGFGQLELAKEIKAFLSNSDFS